MTKPVTPELIKNIILQRHMSAFEVLEKLSSDDYFIRPTKVASNPGQSSEECLEKLGENLDDYDMGEVNAALAEHKKMIEEKEEERRQQELANQPQRTDIVYFEDRVDKEILTVYGFTMSDNNNYVELELYSEESGNVMSHVFKSKEHVERIIAHLQEAAKVFS
jgi:hypothetical protein